ncbi:MAG: protein O-mannosyl-transferase family [Betaproteobacteria bacterium]
MRRDAAHAGAAALVLFSLYAASAPRSVMMEDDGLFVLASYFLGIAHPPGYPLYVLLGKLATLVPFGEVAYRVHLLSAALGALSCAALWLCARALGVGRLAAHVAALGLGATAVFWSQAIIAEVYTLNTLFFFVLLLLALRQAPLAPMAFVFGLSLANHWPLMLLSSGALAVLLWPRRAEIARRSPGHAACVAAGLLPYAWMVWRSHGAAPISFAGPLGSASEVWFFVSRAGYAAVDASPAAGWLDRARYFGFVGAELARQFAVVGTALAVAGFRAQWRVWERGVAIALTAGFLMPTVVLVLLLGFDYDAFHKHVFHVYPLPAYGIAALWMALGVTWLAQRFGRAAAAATGAAGVLLILAVGLYSNALAHYRWVERYGVTLLEALPKDAIVLLSGADLPALAYLHLVEGVRPDVTLYHPQGLVLGNRLFHPYRTDAPSQAAALRALVERAAEPVATTAPPLAGFTWREHWLFAARQEQAGVDIPPSLRKFYDDHLPPGGERNAYIALFKGELRRRYAALNAQAAPAGIALDALAEDFPGALGAAEGLLARPGGYPIRQAAAFLERAAERMPRDAGKAQVARFFELRAYVRLAAGERSAALRDLETSAAMWPLATNGALAALSKLKPEVKP